MKKSSFIGLLIFSLGLNAAVAATVVWSVFAERTKAATSAPQVGVNAQEIMKISKLFQKNVQTSILAGRNRMVEKRLEILDAIAKKPGDFEAVAKNVDEMNELKAQVERDAILQITKTAAELPPEKRLLFIDWLKTRMCMGQGKGCGQGPGCCPMR
jgi:uncharacterized membrane protein